MLRFSLLASVNWTTFGIVLGVFAAIALVLSALILIVTKVCKGDPDEKIEAIFSHLSGANCGGCGCSGCRGFAEKLSRGEASLSDCHVTDAEEKRKIADLIGVPFDESVPTVSVCCCSGGENARNAFDYNGAQNCNEEARIGGGSKVCPYGCLGHGTCAAGCPEDAIALRGGCAKVSPDLCVSCGACLLACPKKLFKRIPADALVYVACSSHARGKAVLDACSSGCIACGKCAKVCPSGAISMQDDLPVILYSKCIRCGKCAEACPRHTIKFLQ